MKKVIKWLLIIGICSLSSYIAVKVIPDWSFEIGWPLVV